MKRAGLFLGLAAGLTLAGAAVGQPKPTPSATPSAAASAAPSAQPKDAKKDEPKKEEPKAEPPGTGSALPPGHPKVDADNADEAVPPGMFKPPQDVAVDDPALPAGSIAVTIKDADNKPIAKAPVTLGILHSTVAKGESRERKSGVADDNGVIRFDGLPFGTGHAYQVTTTRGGASYVHPQVGLSDKVGKRIVLHAYETSQTLDGLPVAMQALVFLQLREDSIQLEQMVSVYNLGKVSWVANQTFELPTGFKAFNKQDSHGDSRVDEVPGQGAALRGTFPPGRNDVDFRYQVPLEGSSSQTLRIRLPPSVAQSRVIAESSRTMGLRVAGFPEAQRTEGRDGKRLLITEVQANRSDGGVKEIEITLTGLPTPDPWRWLAVGLAAVAIAAGGYYFSQRKEGAVDDDAHQDLVEAKEALLGEIVELERAFKSGEVGPKTYERVRTSLLDALARIVEMLDQAAKARAPVKPAKAARA